MKNLLLLSLALCAACFAVWMADAQNLKTDEAETSQIKAFKAVAHKSNPADTLTRAQMSSFLLKKKTRWQNGWQVDPVDLASRAEVRAAMSKLIHERSVASIKNYWQRQIFSGHNTPPPELDSDQAVLEFVSKNPGSIGYVAARTSTGDDVKELEIVD